MGLGEGLADVAGHLHVGRGRGPQAYADVLLADVHDLVRVRIGAAEALHQGALPGARDAGDDAENAQGQVDGNALEVVQGGVFEVEERFLRPFGARNDRTRMLLERHRSAEEGAGGCAGAEEGVVGALEDDAAAVDARAGAQVHDVVGNPDHLRMVLHEEDGVAGVAQALDRALHPLDVAVVQAHAGLVQDVEHIGQRGIDVFGDLAALGLAAGERPDGPVQAQVPEADLLQRREPRADGRLEVHRERIGQVPDPGIQP